MTNKIPVIETKAYKPIIQEEMDIMSMERENYIQERYRDIMAHPIKLRQTAFQKITQFIASFFKS